MKVLVFGSRKWLDQQSVERELTGFPVGTIIVHGAAQGADTIAGYVAKRLGLEVRSYPANWSKDGKAAGPIRNQRMLDSEHPDKDRMALDQAICFHEDPNLGKGSADMAARLKKGSPEIPLRIILSTCP